MPSNAELFIDHLQSVFGKEDAIHKVEAKDGGPSIAVFVYKDIPEEGMITGVTYGLSACAFPAWTMARAEMIVSVESLDVNWPLAAGTFAALFRGEKSFSYGDVFTTDIPLASDTQMDGFLIFAQSILEPEFVSLQVNDYKIHFSQFYPIYKQELAIYGKIGLEAFWKHPGFDMYNVKRKPIRK